MSDDSTRRLSSGALALHANTVVTAGLGYLFLVIASRLYDEAALGRDLALVSAMMFLAALGEFNLGMVLPKFLPGLKQRSASTVMRAYAATCSAGLILAIVFVLVVPRVSSSFEFLLTSGALAVGFVVSVVLWNVFALQDSILVSLRRAIWVPIENGIFGIAKIVLMVVWASSTTDHGVFLAWVVPMAIMVLPISVALFRVAIPAHVRATADRPDEQPLERRQLARYLGLDYTSALLTQSATTLLPAVVLIVLGAEETAAFAIAFSITGAASQFTLNVGISLLVEGSYDKQALARLVRHTFARFGVLLLAMVGGIALLAPLILWPFGGSYSETVPTLLRLMAVGIAFEALAIIYQAVQRVKGNAGRVAASTLAQVVLTLVGVVVLGSEFGLPGIGWAMLTAHAAVALMVAPSLVRTALAR